MTIRVAHVTSIDTSLHILLLNQLKSLQNAGYEVIGISTPGPDVPILEANGIKHIAVPIARSIEPWHDLSALWKLYQLFRQEKFTIVHTHNPKPGLLGQLAARMAKVPIIINTLHGFYFHENMSSMEQQFYIYLERIAASCSHIILSQNKEDMATAIARGICGPDKITYLGNGINLCQFNPDKISLTEIQAQKQRLAIPPDAKVVGFVGRLAARRKGFLDFLQAASRVAQQIPNVRFLIVGAADTGKADAVEPDAAVASGIADKCFFLGHRPNAELPAYYRMMDALVLPSLFEGVPRTVMEAMAMRVPAVVTNVKGNREVVEHGKNGLLVPYGNVAALTEAIVDLLRNPQLARNMGETGYQLAVKHFDEQHVFSRVRNTYAALLQSKGILV